MANSLLREVRSWYLVPGTKNGAAPDSDHLPKASKGRSRYLCWTSKMSRVCALVLRTMHGWIRGADLLHEASEDCSCSLCETCRVCAEAKMILPGSSVSVISPGGLAAIGRSVHGHVLSGDWAAQQVWPRPDSVIGPGKPSVHPQILVLCWSSIDCLQAEVLNFHDQRLEVWMSSVDDSQRPGAAGVSAQELELV
jgi:hypothetical protein